VWVIVRSRSELRGGSIPLFRTKMREHPLPFCLQPNKVKKITEKGKQIASNAKKQ
jgi:hypothetical protein